MSNKNKILFVDDDIRILDGLKRALRGERKQWNMSFVLSSEQGLALMARDRFDALITDLRMPGVNGVQLLSEVARLYPDMVRFILSGYSNEETTMLSVKLATSSLSNHVISNHLRVHLPGRCACVNC